MKILTGPAGPAGQHPRLVTARNTFLRSSLLDHYPHEVVTLFFALVPARVQAKRWEGLDVGLPRMLKWLSVTVLKVRGLGLGADGAGRLAGVLGQCAALAHLDLADNYIGADGAGRLAGVLGQCGALAHLDLTCNYIGAFGASELRASWRGRPSGLLGV